VLHVAVASLASNSQNETRDSELERYVDRTIRKTRQGRVVTRHLCGTHILLLKNKSLLYYEALLVHLPSHTKQNSSNNEDLFSNFSICGGCVMFRRRPGFCGPIGIEPQVKDRPQRQEAKRSRWSCFFSPSRNGSICASCDGFH